MKPGTILWPGWETVQLIGRGSFGAVYEIQRKVFDDVEKAALKVISIPQNSGDIEEMYSDGYDEESITSTFKSHLQSIVAEYSLMRKMNGSANIVSCDDIRYVQHDDGIGWDIFIKMELLTPLTKALPADIPEKTVVKIAKDMCNALVLCKQYDIVHRDIKPQNIFVSKHGDYKLGDFGIAKTVEKTMGGTKIGTYKYMAPEVYNNQPYGCSADIYSLGLVLYWLLNEKRMPFMPLPPAKLKVVQEEDARRRRLSGERLPSPAHGNAALKQIILKACAYDPKDRYASAIAMLDDLKILEFETIKNSIGAVLVNENATDGSVLAKEHIYEIKPIVSSTPTEKNPGFGEQKLEEKNHLEDKQMGVILPNGFWKCVCGRTNAPYISSCVCGKNKRELVLVKEQLQKIQPVKGQNGFWVCSCGRTNASYVSSCACGANKRDFDSKRVKP